MINSQDLISIVFPLHNKEDFLDAQLESIYFQTYKNRELIIVDDYSTDHSKEIALLRKKRIGDNCQIYCNETNLGMNASIQNGFQHIKGKYVAYCDADDIWMRNKLEQQYVFLKQGDYDLVYCDMTAIDENGKILELSYIQSMHGIENNTKSLEFQKFVCSNHVTATSILFDVTLISSILPLPTILYQDRWTMLNASYLNKKIGFQDISLVYYRRFATSMSVMDSKDNKIMFKYKNYLEELLLHIQEKTYYNVEYVSFLKLRITVLTIMISSQRATMSYLSKIYAILCSSSMRRYYFKILIEYLF